MFFIETNNAVTDVFFFYSNVAHNMIKGLYINFHFMSHYVTTMSHYVTTTIDVCRLFVHDNRLYIIHNPLMCPLSCRRVQRNSIVVAKMY